MTHDRAMATVLIIGDGPAGLSAALFLAKNGLQVDVFGSDKTPMHKAKLWNYLGIEELDGPTFQAIGRKQAVAAGARLHDGEVESLERRESQFVARAANATAIGDYLILASGPKPGLVEAVGLVLAERAVPVDRDCRTAIDRIYAVGWAARPDKIQAIISAGDGAVAALDILSREQGSPFHDFDSLG